MFSQILASAWLVCSPLLHTDTISYGQGRVQHHLLPFTNNSNYCDVKLAFKQTESRFTFKPIYHWFVASFDSFIFTSSHHLLLHGGMCSDCTTVPDAVCQKSGGTCRRAKLFKAHLTASCYEVSQKKHVVLLDEWVQILIFKLHLKKDNNTMSRMCPQLHYCF